MLLHVVLVIFGDGNAFIRDIKKTSANPLESRLLNEFVCTRIESKLDVNWIISHATQCHNTLCLMRYACTSHGIKDYSHHIPSQIQESVYFSFLGVWKSGKGFQPLIVVLVLMPSLTSLSKSILNRRTRQLIRYRATVTLRRPQIKQNTTKKQKV